MSDKNAGFFAELDGIVSGVLATITEESATNDLRFLAGVLQQKFRITHWTAGVPTFSYEWRDVPTVTE